MKTQSQELIDGINFFIHNFFNVKFDDDCPDVEKEIIELVFCILKTQKALDKLIKKTEIDKIENFAFFEKMEFRKRIINKLLETNLLGE